MRHLRSEELHFGYGYGYGFGLVFDVHCALVVCEWCLVI